MRMTFKAARCLSARASLGSAKINTAAVSKHAAGIVYSKEESHSGHLVTARICQLMLDWYL